MNGQRELFIDFKTRSSVDLERAGPWKYAEDPSTDLWRVSYAVGNEPTSRWRPGEPVPAKIVAHVDAGLAFVAHDVSFERAIWRHVLRPRYAWPEPKLEQWHSTAAMVAAMALPRSLSETFRVLCLSFQKDADVETGRALLKALLPLLPPLPFEREVWLHDQQINERGITIDIELVRRAQSIAAQAKAKLDAELSEATEGNVVKTTQIEKLQAWCREIQDLQLGTLNHEEIRKLLACQLDLDSRVRRALEIRVEAAKSSTSRLPAFLDRTSADGRMRSNLVYHGASTGRWTAQGAGLQNLPAHYSFKDVSRALDLIMAGWSAEDLAALSPPLEIISACLRPMLIAAPDHELIAADYNAVEARGLAWLAGASKMLGIFQSRECPYLHMASLIYHRTPQSIDPSSRERQLGKKAVLGLGYQMGWETFLEACEKERIFIKPQEACDIVSVYRGANPEIPALWREFEDAAIEAVRNGGKLVQCARDRVAFGKLGSWLYMRLPSGRLLAYNRPELRKQEKPWTGPDGMPAQKWGISFYGMDGDTHKWSRQDAYGGLWVQNATQGLCRDVLANAMLKLEAAGYPVLLSVHDEIVAEVPEGTGDIAAFERIMCDPPNWAAGLPLKAGGWRGHRYRK